MPQVCGPESAIGGAQAVRQSQVPRQVRRPQQDSGAGAPPAPLMAEAGGAATDIFLLTQGADDEGNAQCVAHLHGARFLYCGALGWMRYSGTHWQRENAEPALDRVIVATLQARQQVGLQSKDLALVRAAKPTVHHVRAAKYLLRSLLWVDIAEFDCSPDHLNVANGLLNLRTGELMPHERAQRYTYCLEVEYDPGVDYEPWQRWARQTLAVQGVEGEKGTAGELGPEGDAGLAGSAEERYLQQAVGYTLTGHTTEEVLFCIHGPPRSGKGTFTEALLTLLGSEPLATEVGFATLARMRLHDSNAADLARLKPCRLVVTSEPPRGACLNAAEVKRLTGGNLIYAALKYRDHFAYRPVFKIWLVTNYPPRADVEDDAVWSRLRVIPFPNSQLGREDRGLKGRMKQSEMQRQILAWAVDGARAWYRSGASGLVTPPSVEEATRAAREGMRRPPGSVGDWLAECLEVTHLEHDFVANVELYASYEGWCRTVGIRPQRMTELTQALKAGGLAAGVQRWHEGKNQRGCCGIRLRE